MAKIQGLHLRGSTYYSRITVPKSLIARIGREQIWKSLATSDRSAAEVLHLQQSTFWKAAFVEAARNEAELVNASVRPSLLTPADAAILAQRFFQRSKAQLDLSPISPAELGGEELQGAEEDLQQQLSILAEWRNPDTHRFVEAAATDALAGEGVVVPATTETGQLLSEFLRRALIQLHTIELARLHGDFRDRIDDRLFDQASGIWPSSIAMPLYGAQQSSTLGECIDRYTAEVLELRSVTAKTSLKHRALLAHVGEHFDRATPVATITRADCNLFRDMLAKLPPNFGKKRKAKESLSDVADRNGIGATLSWTTQSIYLKMLSDLLGWAVRERLVADNVAQGIAPLKRREAAEEQRLPFRADELTSIFAAPIYTGCVDDGPGFAKVGANVIRRSRYWLPLVALFSGMRMNEILQLTPEHVRASPKGTSYFVITRDMVLKTENAEREIPVHPRLAEIGFIEWVDQRRADGAELLFDDVPAGAHGYRSDTFTKRFATFLKRIALPANRKSKLSFHSFRHTFKDALNETEASEEIKDELCGWSRSKKTGRRYGTGLSADRLRPYLDAVAFDVDLSHLSP